MACQKKVGRDAYYDNVRGILILLVVVGHFLERVLDQSYPVKAVFLWIYSFHMPLFIFVSGYFSGNLVKDKARVKKRAFEYLSLYLFYKGAICFTKQALGQRSGFHLLSEDGIPWFLAVIAVYSVLVYVFRNVEGGRKNPVLLVSVVLSLLAGLDPEIGDELVLSRIIVFFPYFYLGYLLRGVDIRGKARKLCPQPVAVVLLVLALAACWVWLDELYILRPMFTGRNSYSALGTRANWGVAYRLAAYGISVVMSVLVLAAVPSNLPKIVALAGRNSLQVYLYHRIVIYLLTWLGMFTVLTRYGLAGIGVMTVFAAALTFLLALETLGRPIKAWHRAIEDNFC